MFIKMQIDENQEIFDLSDHNLIQIAMQMGRAQKEYTS